jgi:N utilization substance protein B
VTRRSPPRHHSRRAALQVLYATDLAAREQTPQDPRDVFEGVATHFDLRDGARAFAEELALGVAAHRDELDEHIAAHARNWRVDRMAAVDRNVLRLAVYELLHTGTPASIVLDEAIELARDFGGERSPAFVNGVLDAIARDRPPRPDDSLAPEPKT